jgi:hypothetical protein
VAPTGVHYPRVVRASRRRCCGGGFQCCGRQGREASSPSLHAEDRKTQRAGVSVEALSDIVVTWRHELDVARARRLAQTVAGHLGDDFGVSSAWDGDTLLKRQRSSARAGPPGAGASRADVNVPPSGRISMPAWCHAHPRWGPPNARAPTGLGHAASAWRSRVSPGRCPGRLPRPRRPYGRWPRRRHAHRPASHPRPWISASS